MSHERHEREIAIPEYRPPRGFEGCYPEPEPEETGRDSSEVTRTLLAASEERWRAERRVREDEKQVLDEALVEAWTLIRELRGQVDVQSEQIAALTEYAESWTSSALVAAQSSSQREPACGSLEVAG